MSIWTALVVIVAIAAVYSLKRHRDYLRYGARHPGETAGSAREAELEHEIAELRERVKVLERIATDDRSARAIADEIESLRDK